jgi:hypothetical protein
MVRCIRAKLTLYPAGVRIRRALKPLRSDSSAVGLGSSIGSNPNSATSAGPSRKVAEIDVVPGRTSHPVGATGGGNRRRCCVRGPGRGRAIFRPQARLRPRPPAASVGLGSKATYGCLPSDVVARTDLDRTRNVALHQLFFYARGRYVGAVGLDVTMAGLERAT